VEAEHLWQITNRFRLLRCAILFAFFTFIFHFITFKLWINRALQRPTQLKTETAKRFICYTLVLTWTAFDLAFLDAHENFVDYRRISFKIFINNLFYSPPLIFIRHISIKLSSSWRTFILKWTNQMHKQLMTVMLLTRGELTGYQTFDSFWVVVFWSGALVLWDVLVEVGEFLAEILSIWNGFNFVIFGILFI